LVGHSPWSRISGWVGAALAHLPRSVFVSVMDLAMITGAAAALGGCLLAL